jgi:hypothetical protein
MIKVTGYCDSGHDTQRALAAPGAHLVVHTVMRAVMRTRTPELHFLISLIG